MKKNAQHYWSKHIAAIKFQGITTSAYARQQELSLATLYYWQRKLRSTTTSVDSESGPTQAPKRSSKFIALTVDDSAREVVRSGTPCTLVLAGGMRLEMSTLPDPQWLAAVGRSTQGAY